MAAAVCDDGSSVRNDGGGVRDERRRLRASNATEAVTAAVADCCERRCRSGDLDSKPNVTGALLVPVYACYSLRLLCL